MYLEAQEADDVCLKTTSSQSFYKDRSKELTVEFMPISKSFLFTSLAGNVTIWTPNQIKLINTP